MTSRWMKFYPSDWRSDPALRACTPTARSIWIDLIGLMHEAEPYGYLLLNGVAPSIKTLSGLLNVHHKTLIAGMINLSENGVYSTDENGVIYSRRMVRDHAKALIDQANGRKGGNPGVNPQKAQGVNPPVKGGVKAQKPEARSQIEETPTLRFGVSEPAPPKRAKRAPAPAIRILMDTPITDAARAFAAERGFVNGSCDEMWTHFTAYHDAKRTETGSIEASWRTWVQNQVKFRGEQHGNRFGSAGANGARNGSGARSQSRSAATIIMESAIADALEPEPARSLFGESDADAEPFGGSVPRRVGGVGAG